MGVERVEARILATAAEETAWAAQLRVGLGALLDYFDSEPAVAKALIVEVHAAGPKALAKRAVAMQRLTGFSSRPARRRTAGDRRRGGRRRHQRRRPLASATGRRDGFRQLLPEFVYFAVLPYHGAATASAEMQRT